MSADYSDLERQLEARDVLGLRGMIAEGIEIERFLNSPTGRYLTVRATLELEQATDRLREVDPFDAKAVAAAQLACRVPHAFMQWLGERIHECQAAERQAIEADQSAG